jgi:hypothetical protein
MCDTNIIFNKALEFTTKGKQFTSVDVANAIKGDGVWVRNREVAAFLRENIFKVDSTYTKEVIDVTLPNGATAEATLYKPKWRDSGDYTDRSQKASPPKTPPSIVDFVDYVDEVKDKLGSNMCCDGEDPACCGYTGEDTSEDTGGGEVNPIDARSSSVTFNITINLGS